MGAAFFKVLVIALALALDVFAVSVGVGVRGVSAGSKALIGVAFAFAEVTMNVLGAGLGLLAGRLIGEYGRIYRVRGAVRPRDLHDAGEPNRLRCRVTSSILARDAVC